MKKITLFYSIILLGSTTFLNGQSYNASWTDVIGITVSGNSLTNNPPSGWGAGGAATLNELQANTDGWIEMEAQETNTYRAFGLSETNTNAHYNTIEYAIYLYGTGIIKIFENGSGKGNFGSYTTGDILRIERVGSNIIYKKNGATLYTSNTPSTSTLVGDAAFLTVNSTISNVVASFTAPSTGIVNWSKNNDDLYYNDGNVGIGTANPTGKLHVKNDSSAWSGIIIDHEKTSTSTYALEINVPVAHNEAIAVIQDGTVQFQVDADGKVHSREVKVTLNPFPDYVFENDYDLMPLNQLKTFIDTNKHLPNIPSAKVIDNEGIGLGDLSHKQMEKIEELTLYILQMNERLEKLEHENNTLKDKINQLESNKNK